ncbi:FAST kinase domain-containing protein 5, mitochondrial [Scleropages formosus]|uniref:FAST kinase domain-containing protein 5, mitochondrial n=1 Tax=Scleropages formosus TaxID=113540 RepID=UPI0008788007|nr:FAST kinase domain-containing protein 5, mitochondrial [Scleropages formosus]XP_018589851.1 FAST kinase domain-containing protein 5, mitochondrial [Scleropages formosus]
MTSGGLNCLVSGSCFLTSACRKRLWRAQFLHRNDGVQKRDAEDHNGRRHSDHRCPSSQEHPVQYNPSAYPCPWSQSDLPLLAGCETDEDLTPSTLTTHFRQKSNPYTVSSSRHLSSSKNILLDLAFNQSDPGKKTAGPTNKNEELTPDISIEPRAFQKCRQEYRTMSYDRSLKPPPITIDEAFLLLQKVKVLKSSLNPADIVHILSKLGHLRPDQQPLVQVDTRFIMLLRYSVENLHNFTHTQLLEILRAFVLLGMPNTHSILGLYEGELSCRTEEMDLKQLLLIADLWRCLGRQVPHYLEQLYKRVYCNLEELGVPELVQLLYVVGESRQCPLTLFPSLEQVLLRHLNQLLPEEMGAVSLGLFKSQSSLSERSARMLADRAYEMVDKLSNFALVNVLKLLRFNHIDHRGLLSALRKEIPCRAPQMGVQGLMHVALACSSLHYKDDHILSAVAECLPPLLPHCRSKDAGKLLWSFGMLGFNPSKVPKLYPCLTHALRLREAEFQRFPEHLLTGLLGLAFVGLYPCDLLNLALSPDFVTVATRLQHLDLKKDLFTLDASVGLEIPNWTGPRISPSLGDEVRQQLWRFAQRDACVKMEVLEAEGLLQELLGGESFVHKHMILPHTRSVDLEVWLDHTGVPVPLVSESKDSAANQGKTSSSHPCTLKGNHVGVVITEDLLAQLTNIKGCSSQLSHGNLDSKNCTVQLKEEDDDRIFRGGVTLTSGLVNALTRPILQSLSSQESTCGLTQRLALQVPTRNHFCYQSQQLLGLQVLKRRQLAIAGYRVVDLPPWEWFPMLHRSRAEKLAYLRSKVFGSRG